MSDRRISHELSKFDAAEYLTSAVAIAEYLRSAIEEAGDDPAYLSVVLGDVVRSRGVRELSSQTGLTRQGLYKALAPEGNPSFDTVARVLDALGLALVPVPKPDRKRRSLASPAKARTRPRAPRSARTA